MPYEFYKILHLTGVFGMLLAMGAAAAASPQGDSSIRRFNSMLHGIGLLLILVAGFGMLTRGELGFPGWAILKVFIWLFIGALPMLARRHHAPQRLMLLALALVVVAAWLALARPF